MPSCSPRVSIVVPVRNRRDLLGQLLEALDGQTYRDFEVIVIDDGSTDGSAEEAKGRVVAGRPVQVVIGAGEGAVAARCRGVSEALGSVLAFTDSDCRPWAEWLEAGMAAVDAGADVVCGRTRPARPLGPLERSVWSDEDGLFATCNMFYRRTAFDALGGFDNTAASRLGFRMEPRIRGLGFGEDSLLGWRARRARMRVEFVPDARVDHHVFPPDLVDSLSRSWSMGAFPELIREIPELRTTLMHHRVLFGPRNRLPAYATAGALLTRKRWAVGLAMGWWAYTRLAELQGMPTTWPRRLFALPQEMLLDVVAAAALSTGSVRSRTLLL